MGIIQFDKVTAPEPEKLSDIEIKELYQSAFRLINKYCFAGELPEIDIQPPKDQTGECAACFYFDTGEKKNHILFYSLSRIIPTPRSVYQKTTLTTFFMN